MFKTLIRVWVWLFILNLSLTAAPTESREWTAVGGQKVEASATKVEGDRIVLEKADGGLVKVPLAKFIEADQALLTKHFKIGEMTPSEVPLAKDLAHPQGEVTGPIDAGDGASYYVYLPESLKEGRDAPLLFITNAGGGKKSSLDKVKKVSELLGWVLAVSIESSNKAGFTSNVKVSKSAVAHILKNLPVDKTRVYFTGNSGGGATSLANASEIKAEGAMPTIGYIPSDYNPRAQSYFITGGGGDYNRYTSAHARVEFGNKGIHRMYPGGHANAPEWLMNEGLIWFQCRYLAAHKRALTEEVKDFEYAMLNWLEEKQKTKPYHAYTICRLLMDEYKIEGEGKVKLSARMAELAKEAQNVSYYEGIHALDQFSQDHLSKFGTGSKSGHSDPKVSAAAQLMAEKYAGVPLIEGTFKAIAGKSAKSKK